MKIVNVRHYGGVSQATAVGVVYCGRPSPLGNPYSHRKGTAAWFIVPTIEQAILSYASWLRKRVEGGDPSVIQVFERLTEDSVLGCWCAPGPCHGQIIEQVWWSWKKGQRDEATKVSAERNDSP